MLGPEDHTRELPIVGQAQVPLPVTAIPYTGPYTAPPPPPPKRGRGLFYLAIAAVLVIVCAGGALAGLTFGSDLFRDIASPLQPSTAPPPSPTPPQQTPTLVAEKFLSATVANDQETARGHLCRLLRGEGGQNAGDQQPWLSQLVGFKVSNETVNGPTASVDVSLTVPVLGEIPFGLYLIKEDGGWKVCGFGLS